MNSTIVEANRQEPDAPAGVFLHISPVLLKVSAWPFIGGSEARLQLSVTQTGLIMLFITQIEA